MDDMHVVCPVCGEVLIIAEWDDMTICEECGAWLCIDEDGSVAVEE